jgi:YD repeat-containing protein
MRKCIMIIFVVLLAIILSLPVEIANANEQIKDSNKIGNADISKNESFSLQKHSKIPNNGQKIELTEENGFSLINNQDGTKTLISAVGTTDQIIQEKVDPAFQYSNNKQGLSYKFGRDSGQSIQVGSSNYNITYRALGTNQVSPIVMNNSIKYREAWTDTNLVYLVHGNELKMYMQLSSKEAPKKFQFEIETHNLTYKLLEDNSIEFYSVNDNQTMFTIPQMWVIGADNKEKKYSNVSVDVQSENEKLILSIDIDDTGLTYPLLFDPTVISTDYFSDGEHNTRFLPQAINAEAIVDLTFSIEIINEVYYIDENGDWIYDWDWAPYSGDFYAKNNQGDSFFAGHVDAGWVELSGDEFRQNVGAINSSVSGFFYTCPLYGPPSYVAGYFSVTFYDDKTSPTPPSDIQYKNANSYSLDLSWKQSKDNLPIKRYYVISKQYPYPSILELKEATTYYVPNRYSSNLKYLGTESDRINVKLINLNESFDSSFLINIIAEDLAGNKSEQGTIIVKGRFFYTYNSRGQLESISQDGKVITRFSYDDNGNLKTVGK